MKAHANAIQSIYLADEGSLIATASEKGTLIRLFDLQDEGEVSGVPTRLRQVFSHHAIVGFTET